MDAQLAEKRAASYNVELEKEAQLWIEAVTGESFPGTFQESLKDGVILCKCVVVSGGCLFAFLKVFFWRIFSPFYRLWLAHSSDTLLVSVFLQCRLINKIVPGSVKKIGGAKAPFVQMVRFPATFQAYSQY